MRVLRPRVLSLSNWLGGHKNCFYSIAVPKGLSSYFSLPTIRASFAGISQLHGKRVDPDTVVLPTLRVLPMGWSWALHICQSVIQHQATLAVPEAPLILDREKAIALSEEHPSAIAVYVDNFAVFSIDKADGDSKLLRLRDHFNRVGLPVHEFQEVQPKGQFVGLDFDNGSLRVKASKIWRLRKAIRELLRYRRVSGRLLEALLGHATWAALVKREAFAIFNFSYLFIRQHYDQWTPLPPEARRELQILAGTLPLFRIDMAAQWNASIYCSDACESGIGVCRRYADKEDIAEVGRCREK